MSLKIYLLGQFRLQYEELELELPSRPAQSILAYLVLNAGVTHRREKLASLIWPEASESNARSYLRQALWRIRKSLDSGSLLPEKYLQISDISVAFDEQSDYWLDANFLLAPLESCFVEELIEAVDLYRGELLPGFYEEWVVIERDRLHAAYHQRMNTLLDCLVQDGRWETALKWAEEWIRLGYAPEPAFRALMSAYAGMGDLGMVSSTYQRCVESVDRELGLGPSPETQQLYEGIRRGEWHGYISTPAPHTDLGYKRPPFLDDGVPYQIEKLAFVARESELTQLDQYLASTLVGQGRVVFITGQAGSGKTALLHEFTRRAQDTYAELIVASGNCNAHTGIGDPYLPFREILDLLTGDVESRWAAGAISREQASSLWNTLPVAAQAIVEAGPDLIDTFIPGSPLLDRASTSTSGGANWLTNLKNLVERKKAISTPSNPQQRHLFEQYTRVMHALARISTLVLVIDDLQWADLGSISLLFHMGRHIGGCPILIVGAYRPEEVALGRDGERHPLESVINEFGRQYGQVFVDMDQAERRAFVKALLDGEPNRLQNQFEEMLYRQTGGHPLFTIELLRGMQERGNLIQDQTGTWIEGTVLDWDTLPARVEAVVAERISRLDQELQAVLRVASVQGETFTAEVVARIRGVEEDALLGQLSSELDRVHRLIRAQSIQRLDGQLLSTYRFRHILTQRYLYNSLDEVERVYLHDQVGANLEALYRAEQGDTSEDINPIAPQLARHFQEARVLQKAIPYLQQAGERALQLSAYQEALTHLTTGLELLLTMPDSPERAERELALQQYLGMAWVGPKAYGAEVKTAYTRARQLCQQLGKNAELSNVLGMLAVQSFVQADYRRAQELARESLSMAQQADDPLLVTLDYWYLGFISFSLGEYTTAQDYLKRVTDFYQPENHHQTFLLLRGSDPGTSALAYEACLLWCLGYPDQARAKSEQALTLARQFGHPFSLADAICFAGCWFYAMRRETDALKESAEELMQLADERSFAGWYQTGGCFYGEALALLGQVPDGIKRIRTGMASNEAVGVRCTIVGSLRSLAEAQSRDENPEGGLDTLAEALALVEETGEHHWETELYRLQGELLGEVGDPAGAESSFLKAIEVAKGQCAKSWELRVAISLARLWGRQGKTEPANELLGEIYDWFSEGFDTPDLIEAKSLLEELS